MNKKLVILALSASLLSTGCASIVGGSNQSLSVETRTKGAMVAGAYCKLNNDKGTWYVTTPGSVTVHRSYNDMTIACEKDKMTPAVMTVKSSTKGMLAGNILFGGPIGAGVDAATGAAYDYPAMITVDFGQIVQSVTTPPAK